jgi:hypothetical protein
MKGNYTFFIFALLALPQKSAAKGLALGYISGKTKKQKFPRHPRRTTMMPLIYIGRSLGCLTQTIPSIFTSCFTGEIYPMRMGQVEYFNINEW